MDQEPLLYETLRWVHIVLGAASLATFWVAIFSKKGGLRHVQVGRAFVWAMYGTAASALALCAIVAADPVAIRPVPEGVDAGRYVAVHRSLALFLGYLGIVTFATVRHGVRVLKTRWNPAEIQTPAYRAFALLPLLCGVAMIVLGMADRSGFRALFLAMSPIGIFVGAGMLRYARDPQRVHMQWWYEHIGGMLGGGIAAHTAFLVFGASRLLPRLPGSLHWLPWVLPTVVGIPAIYLWCAHYRRKFGRGEPVSRAGDS